MDQMILNFDFLDDEAQDPATQFCLNWDCHHVAVLGCPQFAPEKNIPNLHDLYDFNATHAPENTFPDQNFSALNHAHPGNSSGLDEKPLPAPAPVCNPTKPKAKKSDRARTLISERKRRSSMKEKLYALRSLVPYITKMDKASIIGDAIRFVQELQMKTQELKAEIADLESPCNQLHRPQPIPEIAIISPPIIMYIFQIEMFEVDSREFYIRMECNKIQGIAALLYKALDSIGLNVKTSNLATTDDQNYLFTFTLNVARGIQMDITLSDLKVWIASAFCNQGFQFSTTPLFS